mmetsp:Transcript_12159/g.26253  ORF Transcript_12159/g.26253 Transcript_12159/m.26253 type:complete len:300 (-) Transcript_12159:368-1267(-)
MKAKSSRRRDDTSTGWPSLAPAAARCGATPPADRAAPESVATANGPKLRTACPVSVASERNVGRGCRRGSARARVRRCESTSASTSRPSASVLPMRTRLPACPVMISSATKASAPIELRTQPSSTSTLRPAVSLGLARAHARMKPAAAAAPHLSRRMPAIPPPTLRSAPPVSYVTPLPAMQSVRFGSPVPLHARRTTHGRWRSTTVEARATANRSGYSARRMSRSSTTSTAMPAAWQAVSTSAAIRRGVPRSGSALPQSRASRRPSSMATARSGTAPLRSIETPSRVGGAFVSRACRGM